MAGTKVKVKGSRPSVPHGTNFLLIDFTGLLVLSPVGGEGSGQQPATLAKWATAVVET